MLKLININKKFISDLGTTKTIFENLNFTANNGDFITIIGTNGAGKSTFLNLLSGQIIPDSGQVLIDNVDITNIKPYNRSKYISKVHQNPSFGTAPSMTVLENMSMAANKGKTFNLSFGLNIKKIEEFKNNLKTLGLGIENQLETNVSNLSGGQRQAMALLMSTFNKPKVLLLDEHTAALDPKTSNTILDKTNTIIKNNPEMITFMITHNMEDAIKYGNRLIMLDKGKIIRDFSKDEKQNLTSQDLLDIFHNK